MSEATVQELDLINIFRGRISDLSLDDEQSHGQHLLRWIRAREGDISKAEEMLRRHIDWRKANGIGPSLLDWKPSTYLTDTYCAKFCGFDAAGSPNVLFTFGQWDLRPALAKGEKKNVIRYKDQALEKLMRLMKLYENQRRFFNLSNSPEKVTQFNCICDWSGFSIRYIMSKEVVEVILEAARSFEANYPETLKAAFNVNCPKVFDVLFKLVKPFLSEHTLSKIFIYDSNEAKWKKDVLSSLPSDQVPVKYGGTRETIWDLADLNLDLHQDGFFFEKVFPPNAVEEEDFENDGYKAVEVAAFDKVSIPILITSPRTTLKWNLKVKKPSDEIDLAIQCEQGNSKREICAERKNISVDSGSVECKGSGNYWIILSNSAIGINESKIVLYKLALDIADVE